jgi:small conductance mechanosensitive channel
MLLQIEQVGMLEKYLQQFVAMCVAYAPKFALAIITLIIGFRIIAWIVKGITNQLNKQKVDASLTPFLVSIFSTILKVMLLLSVASLIGIETTSFVTILGAAGLAVGLALQGSLANFAGGVLILTFRPFKPGDFIECGSHAGFVKEIQIFHTVILDLNDKTIIIANSVLANGAVINHFTQETLLVEVVFGISYANDLEKVKRVLTEAVKGNALVIQEGARAPFVGVLALELTGIKMTFRVWTKPQTYWNLYFQAHQLVKETCDKEGIAGSMPTQTVIVKN